MSFLWVKKPLPQMKDQHLVMRLPRMADFKEWSAVRKNSRDHLVPFEPKWSHLDFDRRSFRNRVRRAQDQALAGTDYTFFIFQQAEGQPSLVGGLTLSNVRFNVACHANLGYWTSQVHTGKGIMTKAVGLALKYSFDDLMLNRIHAAIMPHNAPSRRVLEKNGFVEEGFAEHYLKINGRWEDHVLFGLSRARFQANRFLEIKQ